MKGVLRICCINNDEIFVQLCEHIVFLNSVFSINCDFRLAYRVEHEIMAPTRYILPSWWD